MSTFIVEIRTRYENHPGSNVGAYRARALGRTKKLRTDQGLSSDENHERVARALLHVLLGPDADRAYMEHVGQADGGTHTWKAVKP